ncbi:MAG: two-component system sensor kinase FixL [Candidatus Omnitrophota bacterium]|jgi:two-component system sensor kinase FixL
MIKYERSKKPIMIKKNSPLKSTLLSKSKLIPNMPEMGDLRASEIRYRCLFEEAQDGILILDAESGGITDVNPFLADLLRLPRKKFIGKMLWEIGLFQDVDKSRRAFEQLKLKNYIRYDDLPLMTKGGRYIDVEFISNVYQENGVKMIQCNIRDITARKHSEVERAVLHTLEEEQRRIGQDLHDGLCQELTGVALLARALARKLIVKAPKSSTAASEIADLIVQSIEQTRDLARGLSPVEIEVAGLVYALQKLADTISGLYKISCQFVHSESTDIQCLSESILANHLYRIAQEAVTNAIQHGKADHVVIKLDVVKKSGLLTIEDDGIGFDVNTDDMPGMGLRSMRYRGRLIGAGIKITQGKISGTIVTCAFKPNKLSLIKK